MGEEDIVGDDDYGVSGKKKGMVLCSASGFLDSVNFLIFEICVVVLFIDKGGKKKKGALNAQGPSKTKAKREAVVPSQRIQEAFFSSSAKPSAASGGGLDKFNKRFVRIAALRVQTLFGCCLTKCSLVDRSPRRLRPVETMLSAL
jgi:hypothetical protein